MGIGNKYDFFIVIEKNVKFVFLKIKKLSEWVKENSI